MPEYFKPTAKQREALRLAGGDATHVMAFGGSRSGKTFNYVRAIVVRALAAPGSRHVVLRFLFNAVKASVVLDTFPKVMRLCFPDVPYHMDRSDWYAKMPGGSEIWFGGLDDKERTEKILGQEYATLFFNESSQIPWSSVMLAHTRLAQLVAVPATGQALRLKAFYDCNPPSQAHWTYRVFIKKVDPDSGKPLARPDDYASVQLNPRDNIDNLPTSYLATLESLPARMRARFLDGVFGSTTEGALWTIESIDRWRTLEQLPDMQRVVVGVDPSGAGDTDNAGNDEIGIVVCGLGLDGYGYMLDDVTCKAGPAVWGKLAATTYARHQADLVVAEKNFGGDMVRFVLQTADPNMPVKVVTASRGKVVRAEPVSALNEQGKTRFAGAFPKLEDELCSFTPGGYMGANSPNRADAYIWAMSELFPGIARPERKLAMSTHKPIGGAHSWMGGA